MKRTSILTILLALAIPGTGGAGTFDQVAIAPQAGVETLDREAARRHLDRDLLSAPYATVVIANIDIYDEFPYLEARYLQVVSDPSWDRLLTGETGTGLAAFDGRGTEVGPLSEPRGLALGADGRVYLCDTGNNRIVVMETRSEFSRLELIPVGTVDGLRRPYDVAYSDAGTPDRLDDDRLYVAETGRNRVASYALESDGARLVGTLGELGGGLGHFAGPMAVAVGRADGVNTADVLVADAHSRRLVRLKDKDGSLEWIEAIPHDFDVVTSLDTDHWGNVYVTGPARSTVAKYSPSLEPVAELPAPVERPRSFHVLFADVHDHTTGERYRSGQARGVLVESWSDHSGIRVWSLGVEVRDLKVETKGGIESRFVLTDRAAVSAEILDPQTGTVLARTEAGSRDAGSHRIGFAPEDFLANLDRGDYLLRVTARSPYEEAKLAQMEIAFASEGTGYGSLPERPRLLGSRPNPFSASTNIRFLVPDGPSQPTSLRVFDLQGRLVRILLNGNMGPGSVSVTWEGRDDQGRALGSGIYLYQVVVGDQKFTDKMILIR
jgi:hypothetical protein